MNANGRNFLRLLFLFVLKETGNSITIKTLGAKKVKIYVFGILNIFNTI